MKNETKENNMDLEYAARKYFKTGCKEAKKEVVMAGEALVHHYAGLFNMGNLDEDLRQVAYEGLLKALKRFEPDREIKFSTYATHCITGEIRHELRSRGPFKTPGWMKRLQARVITATEELAQQNGAMPSLIEISLKVNIDKKSVAEVMQLGCISLDEIDLSKLNSLYYEKYKLPIEDIITVQMSLEKLDEIKRKVLELIYYEGLTQQEIAMILGINQRKVSRLLNRGLKEMRDYIV